jgi:N-acetylmuramoyl-L-alanine amidase
MTTLRQITVAVALLLLPIVAHAQSLTVAWDPNPSSDQVTGYEVCIGTASLSCNVSRATVAATESAYTFTPTGGVLYFVAVRAHSAAGAGAYSQEVTVSAPSLSQPANPTSVVGQAISPLSLSASDPDGDTLQFSHTGLPFGLTLNATTGIITGTPTNAGTFNVTVLVADDLVTASRSFVWTVSGGSSDTTQPTVNITSHTSGQSVTTSSITLVGTATDSGTGNSGITGVTVNGAAATGGTASSTGTANWSRTVALSSGANALTVVATDGAGTSRSVQITITRASSSETTAPSVWIGSHTSGQTVTSSLITVAGGATDGGTGDSGIANVTVNGSPATGGTASGNGTASWSRSVALSPGANTLTVVATDGAGNQRTGTISVTYSASTSAMTAASLSQNLASPQTAGVSITFTASGSGGAAPYQYQWYVQPSGGGASMVRSWSTTSDYTWTPTQAGTYVVSIWARSAGETANVAQATAQRTFVINAPTQSAPLLLNGISSDRPAPVAVGTPVTFTAAASGGQGVYHYKWWIYDGVNWVVTRQWSSSNQWTWTPTTPSTATRVAVWVRNAGSTADAYDNANSNGSIAFPVTTAGVSQPPPPSSPTPSSAAPLTLTAITPNMSAPQPVGTAVTFVASATGGTAPYQYKWWTYDGGNWMVMTNWSTSNSWTWTPGSVASGSRVGVWVRSADSTADRYDNDRANGSIPFAISPGGSASSPAPAPQPPSGLLVLTAISADRVAPMPVGNTVRFTASIAGGSTPHQYKWWIYDGSQWIVTRGWSTDNTWTWTPSSRNSAFRVGVWVRNAGSAVDAYDNAASNGSVAFPVY